MCWWQAFICNGLSELQLLNQGTRSLALGLHHVTFFSLLESWVFWSSYAKTLAARRHFFRCLPPDAASEFASCGRTFSELKDPHQTATGSLRSVSSFRFPWPPPSLGGIEHEKICAEALFKYKHTNATRGRKTSKSTSSELESSARCDIFGGPAQTSGEEKEKPSFQALRASFLVSAFVPKPEDVLAKQEATGPQIWMTQRSLRPGGKPESEDNVQINRPL